MAANYVSNWAARGADVKSGRNKHKVQVNGRNEMKITQFGAQQWWSHSFVDSSKCQKIVAENDFVFRFLNKRDRQMQTNSSHTTREFRSKSCTPYN